MTSQPWRPTIAEIQMRIERARRVGVQVDLDAIGAIRAIRVPTLSRDAVSGVLLFGIGCSACVVLLLFDLSELRSGASLPWVALFRYAAIRPGYPHVTDVVNRRELRFDAGWLRVVDGPLPRRGRAPRSQVQDVKQLCLIPYERERPAGRRHTRALTVWAIVADIAGRRYALFDRAPSYEVARAVEELVEAVLGIRDDPEAFGGRTRQRLAAREASLGFALRSDARGEEYLLEGWRRLDLLYEPPPDGGARRIVAADLCYDRRIGVGLFVQLGLALLLALVSFRLRHSLSLAGPALIGVGVLSWSAAHRVLKIIHPRVFSADASGVMQGKTRFAPLGVTVVQAQSGRVFLGTTAGWVELCTPLPYDEAEVVAAAVHEALRLSERLPVSGVPLHQRTGPGPF